MLARIAALPAVAALLQRIFRPAPGEGASSLESLLLPNPRLTAVKNALVVLLLVFVEVPQSALQAVAGRWRARRSSGPGRG